MKRTLKLKLVKAVKIKPSFPFDFNSTFYKPDHFTTGDNFWQTDIRWQTWNWQGRPLGIKFLNRGSVSQPVVEIKIYANYKISLNSLHSLLEEIKYSYNFNLNLKDFYQNFKNDKILGKIIKKWRGLRPGHPSSLYEYLIIGIVLQNASVRRSAQMFQALLQNYGTLLDFAGKQLWCFWKPGGLKNISEDELRLLKVGYRAKTIKKIDEQFVTGQINELDLRSQNRETQMSELLKLYGVGPATVWYILFDVFHHLDYFDHISPWEQKIYSKLFFNRDPENPIAVSKLLKYLERFGKYKQLAVHYVWEDLFWRRRTEKIPWLEKEIRQ